MTNSWLAARVSAIYLLIGCLWILLSDWLTFADANVREAHVFQTAKGLGYVFATAGLLFWLIRRCSRLLCESDARFRLLVESAPDAVLVQSEKRIVYMNAAALRLIGATSADQLVGREVIGIIHPDSRDVVKGRITSVTDGKSPVVCQEETYMRLDGAPVVCEVSAVPIRFDCKDSALVFIRDTTERKLVQERQSNEQRMEMVRQLAGGLAHELNNLVHVINGNAELAHSSLSPGAPEQRYLDHILHAGGQVADWIGKITVFSNSPNSSIESLKLLTKSTDVRTLPPDSQEEVGLVQESPPVPAAFAESAPATEAQVTVLLAEDDGMVRSLTERFLKKAGYSVLLARDGAEAVAMFEANACRISAVLLDVVMPRMGGFEAYARIRAWNADMPILFASGFSGYETTATPELIRGVNFLQKPYDQNELITAIRQAIGRRRADVSNVC